MKKLLSVFLAVSLCLCACVSFASCGASAKFTGSGGAIIGTYENEAMFENLCSTLKKYNVDIIRPNIVMQ